MSEKLTLLYFEKGQAPTDARRVAILPPSEWEVFEGETGVRLRICEDAETKERLWFHAALTLDVDYGPITTSEERSRPIDLYLLPVVEPE